MNIWKPYLSLHAKSFWKKKKKKVYVPIVLNFVN